MLFKVIAFPEKSLFTYLYYGLASNELFYSSNE